MLMEEEDKKSADTLCNTITKLALTSKSCSWRRRTRSPQTLSATPSPSWPLPPNHAHGGGGQEVRRHSLQHHHQAGPYLQIMLMEEEDKKSADTLCNTITK